MDRATKPWITACILLAVCLSSLFFPAIFADDPHSKSTFLSGLDVLVAGWLGVLVGNVGWGANLSFLVALLAMSLRSAKMSLGFSVITLVFALHALTIDEIFYSEAGSAPVLGFGTGCYIWITSFALEFLAALYYLHRSNNSFKPKPLRCST